MLAQSQKRQLDDLAYLLLPGFVPPRLLGELRERVETLWELEGDKAGTVVVMNTHMWHGGTANGTDHCRRALHGFYTRNDKPQQQYQKALLRPETVAALTPAQRRVLALDDAENDRLSSATTRMSGFLK